MRKLDCRKYIFRKVVVIAEKIKKNFNRFVTTRENVRAGVKKMRDFSMFFGRWDLVYELFEKSSSL